MSAVYALVLIALGLLFYFNKKLTEGLIVQNVNILLMKDFFYTRVYRYMFPDDRKDVSIFGELDKELTLSVFKRKAWNPLRSIVPFKYGFLLPNMRAALEHEERFLADNHHMAFVVACSEEFQRELKKYYKNMDNDLKMLSVKENE